jgi:hypothetical protein
MTIFSNSIIPVNFIGSNEYTPRFRFEEIPNTIAKPSIRKKEFFSSNSIIHNTCKKENKIQLSQPRTPISTIVPKHKSAIFTCVISITP